MPCIWAASDKDPAPEEKPLSKTELRNFFKERVKTEDNGDVLVDIRNIKPIEFPKESSISFVEAMFLSYVDKNLDVKKLSEMIDKANSKKSASKGLITLDALFSSIAKYLAPKNMNLQKMSFSEGNIRQRLGDGLPILCIVASSDEYGAIASRNSERDEKFKDASQKKEWSSYVSKNAVKIKDKNKRVLTSAMLIGFNPDTDEYLVLGLNSEIFWMHAKEIKQVFHSAYALRF